MPSRQFSRFHFVLSVVSVLLALPVIARAANDEKLNIICFGAHPDDCELQVAGVATMWGRQGASRQIRLRDQRRHRALA